MTITIRGLKGGASWWEIKGRGQTWKMVGWWTLDDVMRKVLGHE